MANGFNMLIGSKVDTAQLNTAIGDITKSVQTAINNATAGKLTKTVSTYVRNIANADGTTKKYIKTLTSYTNAQGQSVDATGKVVKQGTAFLTNQKSQITSTNKATQTIKTNTTAVEKNATAVQSGSNAMSKFVTTISRVAYVKLAADALSLFTTACNEAKEAIFELDEAITEFNKVSDLSENGNLQEYIEQLGELGETVGRTRSEMLSSATSFVKSGYSEEDAKTLAQINSLLQNVADSEMSTDEAANVLISTMKAFNIEGEDAIHIVDAINEVSNHFALSSSDLSDGLANVASTASAAGNSLEQTEGLLTAMVEITQSASKSSRGLKFCLGTR